MPRPPASVPERGTEGGGGTTTLAALPRIPCTFPETVLCSCIGSRGAGATTSDRPMLRSEILCIAPPTTGAGPTTVALGVVLVRNEKRPPTFEGGLTAETFSRPVWRPMPCRNSGGGATTAVALSGPLRCDPPLAASGAAGRAGRGTRISGRAAAPLILMSGGTTSFWACSGATRIVAARKAAVCPFDCPRTRPGLLRRAGKVGSGR
jgi:hypothetical protein